MKAIWLPSASMIDIPHWLPIPRESRLWQLTNTIWPMPAAAVLLAVGFNSGVGVDVTSDPGETVRDGFELVGRKVGVKLAATEAVGLLIGARPNCGRLQARVIKTIPRIQIPIFFMLFPPRTWIGVGQSLVGRSRSPRRILKTNNHYITGKIDVA
jgi:hypothetical protein